MLQSKIHLIILLIFVAIFGCEPTAKKPKQSQNMDRKTASKIKELLAKMTLEEKLGQLNLYVGDFDTGPNNRALPRFDTLISQGKITGLFNTYGAVYTGKLQKIAVKESRLGIPLLFGADVIHGFRTVFPIPLGEAASWDMEAVRKSAATAAKESTAVGINWDFAPMVDITRDARWGRVAEGAGEDPYLGSLVAAARVKGFQGESLSAPHTMGACVKHFAGYGASEAGKDYNTVDMSERLLREIYLPPYRAAVDAGAASLMTSFNELNGTPATGNKFLVRQILRKEWGFAGMIVSDWQSIGEMVVHGSVANRVESAEVAIKAGIDMDMMSNAYYEDLPTLVAERKVDMRYIDEAVINVLKLKFQLGLFENPYKYSNVTREKNDILSPENLADALEISKKSIVLLKNKGSILPLKKDIKTIAVIGALAGEEMKGEHNGTWSFFAKTENVVSIIAGIKNKVSTQTKVLYADGYKFYSNSTKGFDQALKIARQADVVILSIGETAAMNGEAGSRANISLPGNQQQLVNALAKTAKPIVALITTGRPLGLSEINANIPAILCTWTLGTQTGNAIAEVLFGDYNPAGKLPISFPRSVGQIPIYYNHKNTGRPYPGDYSEHPSQRVYHSKYIDVRNSPLYPFGYGLSYTSFQYGDIKVGTKRIRIGGNEKLSFSIKITNTGSYAGEEVVQLYTRDLVGSVTRPVKELKAFEKISLAPGESKKVRFELSEADLAFHRKDMSFGVEPGAFKVFIGTNSRDTQESDFYLE